MAESEKNGSPPSKEISAPKALVPLMQAFHAESEEAAKALIKEAAEAITPKEFMGIESGPSKEDMKNISDLMRGLNPLDSLETLYAAQIIVSHLLGIRKLASEYSDDQKLGMRMLKFSNEAIQELNKKRGGGTQNITVNYHHHGVSNSFSQTVLRGEEPCQ